jgi:uncharacterized protein (DUF983 family)
MQQRISRSSLEADMHAKSLGELLSEFAAETTTLVRQEVELGKAEMKASVKEATKDTGAMAAGGVIAHIGAVALATALILALGTAIPYWASALIVGVVLAAIGLAAIAYGKKRLAHARLAPRMTMESVKRSAITIKEQAPWTETH